VGVVGVTRLLLFLLAGLVAAMLLVAADSSGHLPYKGKPETRAERHALQTKNLYHARYVCRRGDGPKVRAHCLAATGWLLREWRETLPEVTPGIDHWAKRQMAVAEKIGRGGDDGGTDPWPNCPDPYDHAGHSWLDTVKCENTRYWQLYRDERVWLDPPGFYRCGLQFDPMWERKYGRLCP
jgi:hypothetical protein